MLFAARAPHTVRPGQALCIPVSTDSPATPDPIQVNGTAITAVMADADINIRIGAAGTEGSAGSWRAA